MNVNPSEAVGMIINHWKPEFTKLYGHYFPESYLCWDTEFTGGNAEKDLIMEIGHCMVRDRQIVDELNLVLDWSRCDIVDSHWLRRRLAHQRLQMGSRWRVTWDVMKQEGIHPLKALEFYYKLFAKWSEQNLPFVAHNGYQADERMFAGNVEGFLVKPFRFRDNEMIDSGAIHKASMMLLSSEPTVQVKCSSVLPKRGDTFRSYFKRVVGVSAKGVIWRMDECLKYYDLIEKHNLDLNKLHTAQYDSYCVHLLIEEYRKYITHNNSGESGLESGAALGRMFEEDTAQGLIPPRQVEAAEAQRVAPEISKDVRARLQARRAKKVTRKRGQRSV